MIDGIMMKYRRTVISGSGGVGVGGDIELGVMSTVHTQSLS